MLINLYRGSDGTLIELSSTMVAKENLMATEGFQPIRHDTLEHFVYDLVEVRFSVYAKASMRMLVHWQALEPDTSQFYGQRFTPHPLFDISDHIQILQENSLVRSDQDYQVLSGAIFGLVSYSFFDFANAFNLSNEKRASYKKFVCEMLIQILKPEGNSSEVK